MTTPTDPTRDRIDSLDILRGLAILGILLLNMPGFATYYLAFFTYPPAAGWTPADQITWGVLEGVFEGTQRGLLQLLFGAGMMILAAPVMRPDGPVSVADEYLRRNLWLLAFGLLHIFVLLFPGDILFIYAIAALFIFPFRRLAPRALLAITLAWLLVDAGLGAARYAERAEAQARVAALGGPDVPREGLSEADAGVLERWAGWQAELAMDEGFMAYDRDQRLGDFATYARYAQDSWLEQRAYTGEIFFISVPEAFAVMLLGAALFRWGVIQGRRSRRFYLGMMLAAYAVAIPLRWLEIVQTLPFTPAPRLDWITGETARLALTLGHLAAVHLLLSTRAGQALLAPFKAAGRTAFSLYLLQSLACGWLLFPAFGLGWFARFGWAEFTALALALIAAQLVLANLWLRGFRMGPVEWLWRSLVKGRRLPMRA